MPSTRELFNSDQNTQGMNNILNQSLNENMNTCVALSLIWSWVKRLESFPRKMLSFLESPLSKLPSIN